LQQKIQSQQEEMFKLETNLQDYRAKLDVLREDNENLLKRVNIRIHRFHFNQSISFRMMISWFSQVMQGILKMN